MRKEERREKRMLPIPSPPFLPSFLPYLSFPLLAPPWPVCGRLSIPTVTRMRSRL